MPFASVPSDRPGGYGKSRHPVHPAMDESSGVCKYVSECNVDADLTGAHMHNVLAVQEGQAACNVQSDALAPAHAHHLLCLAFL